MRILLIKVKQGKKDKKLNENPRKIENKYKQ